MTDPVLKEHCEAIMKADAEGDLRAVVIGWIDDIGIHVVGAGDVLAGVGLAEHAKAMILSKIADKKG